MLLLFVKLFFCFSLRIYLSFLVVHSTVQSSRKYKLQNVNRTININTIL